MTVPELHQKKRKKNPHAIRLGRHMMATGGVLMVIAVVLALLSVDVIWLMAGTLIGGVITMILGMIIFSRGGGEANWDIWPPPF